MTTAIGTTAFLALSASIALAVSLVVRFLDLAWTSMHPVLYECAVWFVFGAACIAIYHIVISALRRLLMREA